MNHLVLSLIPPSSVCCRSLFSRCVEPDEVGKIFSAVAIITAVAPLASNIAMRKLYSATLNTYPQAFMVYTGALFLLATALNFYLWTNRQRDTFFFAQNLISIVPTQPTL